MSASTQSRIAGFNALLAVSGETLRLGVAGISALVNRNVVRPRDALTARDGRMDFSVIGLSEVEFLFTSFNGTPEAGDSFLDGIGFRHRVKKVSNTDITWVCVCDTSKVP